MLDLGRSFAAVVERDPDALAIVDGGLRLSYREWLGRIASATAGLRALGLHPGDHLVTVLQNRWEAATLHWACQFAGVVITPLNWRATSDELDYVLGDAEARALVYEAVAAPAVSGAARAADISKVVVGEVAGRDARTISFDELLARPADGLLPAAPWDALSLMLYTSGTTGRGKGVPRRHGAERSAAVAHVAQNQYRYGERTLGVMPLYHTMGVRSLLAMALVSGTFVCLPRFDPAKALALIEAERITNLYLVPTLYHDLLAEPGFADRDLSSVRKLGFAGAPMTDGCSGAWWMPSGRTSSSITTARQRSTPSPSVPMRLPNQARPARPASISRSASSASA